MSAKVKTIQREYRRVSQLGQEERDRMLMENLPQVHYIARRTHDRLPPHVPLEDLVSAGIVGLLEAIHNFDPGRSENIKGYAKHRIQGAILDSLRDLDWSPRDLRKKGRQIEEALHKLRTSLGRAPSESELAESQGLSLKELQNLLAELWGLHLGSLQALALEAGQEDEIDKYLPNASEEDQLYLCQRWELRECLAHAVRELPDRERQMFALYYVEELTMKEVGAVLGVGEGRISQLHSAALHRLRERIQELLSMHRCERAFDRRCEGTGAQAGKRVRTRSTDSPALPRTLGGSAVKPCLDRAHLCVQLRADSSSQSGEGARSGCPSETLAADLWQGDLMAASKTEG